jgi:hypothetical protein
MYRHAKRAENKATQLHGRLGGNAQLQVTRRQSLNEGIVSQLGLDEKRSGPDLEKILPADS